MAKKSIKVNTINKTKVNGNVDVTIYRGKRKCGHVSTHNTGTLNLCKFIAEALCGKNIIAERPGVIIPFTSDGITQTEIGNGTTSINSRISQVNDATYSCKLTFLIPNSILTNGTVIKGFNLYSKAFQKNKENYLFATVNFEETTSQIVITNNDVSLRVEWTLYISFTETGEAPN